MPHIIWRCAGIFLLPQITSPNVGMTQACWTFQDELVSTDELRQHTCTTNCTTIPQQPASHDLSASLADEALHVVLGGLPQGVKL